MSDTVIRGMDRFLARLRHLSATAIETGLGPAHGRAAQVIGSAAAGRVPRRSGYLASTGSARGDAHGATVVYGAAYAGPIHYGWAARGIRPQMFLWEASQTTRPSWENIYEDRLRDVVDRS